MRRHVKEGNFDEFRKNLPSHIQKNEDHAKELFHDVKGGLKEQREMHSAIIERLMGYYRKSNQLHEAFLHDPDTYLRMATQAREQGKIMRAALLTRIASAIRRQDNTTAIALRQNLPATVN